MHFPRTSNLLTSSCNLLTQPVKGLGRDIAYAGCVSVYDLLAIPGKVKEFAAGAENKAEEREKKKSQVFERVKFLLHALDSVYFSDLHDSDSLGRGLIKLDKLCRFVQKKFPEELDVFGQFSSGASPNISQMFTDLASGKASFLSSWHVHSLKFLPRFTSYEKLKMRNTTEGMLRKFDPSDYRKAVFRSNFNRHFGRTFSGIKNAGVVLTALIAADFIAHGSIKTLNPTHVRDLVVKKIGDFKNETLPSRGKQMEFPKWR